VKKVQGQLTVIVKQKDSDVKYTEFTPNRYFLLLRRRLLITVRLRSNARFSYRRLSVRVSIRPSVRLSVCQTRVL